MSEHDPSIDLDPNQYKDRQLRQWVQEACQHPPGSPERQKRLTQIIRVASKRLWTENIPEYQDALQQTWVFFCLNLCEGATGERYDPDRASVVTWLNYYLKRRLQTVYQTRQKQMARTVSTQAITSRSGETEGVRDPVETIAAPPDVPPLLDDVRSWAMNDPEGDLRRIFIEGHPKVNCQYLILRRLPPETSWKELANETGLSVSTLSSFYQRKCLPRLRKFGESQGYI